MMAAIVINVMVVKSKLSSVTITASTASSDDTPAWQIEASTLYVIIMHDTTL